MAEASSSSPSLEIPVTATLASTPPEGFTLQHNAVSSEAWHLLEKWMNNNDYSNDGIEWEETEHNQNRPTAQFGFRYNYHRDIVEFHANDNKASNSQHDCQTPPIPEILQRLLLDPLQNTDNNENNNSLPPGMKFTQCIINDYKDADTVIPWHRDDMAFGDIVLVYTFLDERPLHLRSIHNNVAYTAHPRHCSRYILRGTAREHWEHCVPAGSSRRVSFTFRTLRQNDEQGE